MVKVKEDLTGKVFGNLTVLERIEDWKMPCGRSYPRYRCQCICGNIIERLGGDLNKNANKSKIQECNVCAAKHGGKKHKKHNKYDLSGEYGIRYASNTGSD